MMALIGTLHDFNPDTDSWISWVERFEQYLTANGILETKQVAVFLTAIGAKVYDTLRDLLYPEKPASKPLAVLVTLLRAHYPPQPIEIAERWKFYKRHQEPGESVSALRKLASTCQFGEYLVTALRDQFVMGLQCEAMSKRLLTKKELTLHKAMDIASIMEQVTKEADALHRKQKTEQEVEIFHTDTREWYKRNKQYNSLRQRTVHGEPQNGCYRCGVASHESHSCRFRNAVCHSCGNKEHTKRVCKKGTEHEGKTHKLLQKRAYQIQLQDSSDDSDGHIPIQTVKLYKMNSAYSAIPVPVKIEGKYLTMDLDKGAAVSVITEQDWRRIKVNIPVIKTAVCLQTFSKEVLTPLGSVHVRVQLNGRLEKLMLYIMKSGGPPLFGREWIHKLGMPDIKYNACHALQTLPAVSAWIQDLQRKFSPVFDDTLGTVKGRQMSLNMRENAVPIFFKARTVPFALKAGVEAELMRLENLGIISRVRCSEWASPIVRKKNGDIRICGDFRMAVNSQLAVDKYPLPKIEDIFATLAGTQQFTKLDLKHAYLQLPVHPESRPYLTINTHKGLFQYNRMVFGIAQHQQFGSVQWMNCLLECRGHNVC
uniref:Reverse transcriptase domain-containing protein n=1 Tax=Leptobrachium leishanense TaxID=445787 RepID=A0A8C5PU77_9ANUR